MATGEAESDDFAPRPGERALDCDPAEALPDAGIVFIGRIRTPWKTRADCPKNLVKARERGKPATVVVDEAFRPGLEGLEAGNLIVLLYWMHAARRDLIIQAPRHRPEPVGVFALRSPVRPNPVAMAVVRLLDIDRSTGRLTVDAMDCVDTTPLVDIKPWVASIDNP